MKQAAGKEGDAPQSPPSPLPTLECKTETGTSDPSVPLTVGDIFKIECVTDSFTLNPSQLKIETTKSFQLKLLQSEVQPDGRIFLKVTSYQVGEIKSEGIVLTDGVNKVALTGVNATVASVIDKNNPPKGPYGPFGGFVLSLPFFYLWIALVVVAVSVAWVGFRFYRRWQRKRLIEGLKKHDSRLTPLTQLHGRFRQLERQRVAEQQKMGSLAMSTLVNQLGEMDEIMRVYIIRQFKIPAQNWSDRLILKDFQSRFAFLGTELAKDLRVLLREIKKNKERVQKQGQVQNQNQNKNQNQNQSQNATNTQATQDDKKERDIERLEKQIKRWADHVDRNLHSLSHSAGMRS